MRNPNPTNRPWGKFRSVEDSPRLQSYNAEVFCDRRSGVPLFVMWTREVSGNGLWHVRGITDEFHHDVEAPAGRLQVIKYVEDLLKILEEDYKKSAR